MALLQPSLDPVEVSNIEVEFFIGLNNEICRTLL